MASLSNDRGLRRILVTMPDGSRPAIRLGRIPLKDARTILGHVEHLVTAKLGRTAMPPATASWLGDTIDAKLRDRLVLLGLAAPIVPVVEVKRVTVSALVAQFKNRPKWQQLAPATTSNYGKFFQAIMGGLGSDTPIDDVTQAGAEDLRGYLLTAKPSGAGFGQATASRCVGAASMLFRFAVRSRLLGLNPFEGVEQGSMATAHKTFVDDETSRLVLDALEGTEWRLLFALGRWGGLRVPSEPRALRWGDIDRANERFTVNSPKTGKRVLPIFPELAPLIADRFDDAEPGEELVLPFMAARSPSTFSSHIAHVVKKLQLAQWPRLWHNMRSTRQTELEERFPSHVVCSWLGNSPDIARIHYLQTTEAHFDRATGKCAQNAAQTARVNSRQTVQE